MDQARIDQLIREAYQTWPKKSRLLRLSDETGLTRGELVWRAVKLGCRKPPGSALTSLRPKKNKRACLRCDGEFMSDGIYNRICPNCRETNSAVSTAESHALRVGAAGMLREVSP